MPTVNTRSIVRISVSDDEAPGDNYSYVGDMSADGRFVVFYSSADTLSDEDADQLQDVYLRDTLTGQTSLISRSYTGGPENNNSSQPDVSDDGRFVSFDSDASNIVDGDFATGDGGWRDVFVRDVHSGVTIRVSQTIDGVQGNGSSYDAEISGDGRFVAFSSYATNLVAGGTSAVGHILLNDLLTNETQLISRSTSGTQGNGFSYGSSLSADGRYVAYASNSTNLVAGDTNNMYDIFIRDTVLDTTKRVSVFGSNGQGDNTSANASVSADGRYVTFDSTSTNLVASDTDMVSDIFLRDVTGMVTTRVSVSSTGGQADNSSYNADVSADGRYVVFESNATNLVDGDTNNAQDIFLRDTVLGVTTRLSVGPGGVQLTDGAGAAKISDDGTQVVFQSFAPNLTPGDANGEQDVFRISLFATESADYLLGSDSADTINGLGGADVISTGIGNDALNGGTGADQMYGGIGADRYVVDNIGDKVFETNVAGLDTVQASVSFTITGYVEQLSLTGASAIDGTGNSIGNTIIGNGAANVLNGKGAGDTLTGGAGADTFAFDTTLSAANVDLILDFNVVDTIQLSKSIFGTIVGTGTLTAAQFKANSAGAATDADDRIIYDTDDGRLFFDLDGNGAGSKVQFAVLAGAPAITNADFFIVA